VALENLSEELLLDFQELIGEHFGEKMAEAVWNTLKTCNLTAKVCFIFA